VLSFLDHGPSALRPILAALLLVLVTIALYSPVRHHPFVNYDDGIYVANNDHVKHGFHYQTIKWAITSYDAANWHPLTWLSHMLDYQLFQDNPSGHHEVNLLLHAFNAALLFWVLMRATGREGPSLMVAALFALHPINTETVAWIAERKNLLSMLFFLLALGAWGWYARKPQSFRYLVVMFLFALGLMSKPQVVTLPFVLLLWDYWPLERMSFAGPPSSSGRGYGPARNFWSLLEEKLPLLALSAASAILTVKAQSEGGGFNPDYTFFQRIENAAVSYVRYIGKALWPSHLALVYPHPGNALQAWQAAALALLVLIAISVFVVRFGQHRYLLVGWLWFLGTLVPMIGLMQVGRQAMADRYAYLPFVGLFIMVCWGVSDWAQHRQLSPAWLAAPACALLLLAALTHRQISYWSDNVTLWTHTTQVTTGNFAAEDELADALIGAGRPDEAQLHFLRAAEISPNYPPTLMFLAVRNQELGNQRQAIAQYQQVLAVSQSPTMRAKAFANMGHAYRELGEMAPARDSLQAALALNSRDFAAWLDLGLVSQQTGDLPSAIHDYFQAVALHPFDVGYLVLAQALKQSAHPVEAKWAEQKAKDLTADYRQAQQVAALLVANRKAPN
jgi:tetratricopeptide (TPR) repeat protein